MTKLLEVIRVWSAPRTGLLSARLSMISVKSHHRARRTPANMNIFIALFIFSLLEVSCNGCATKSSTPPAPPAPPAPSAPAPPSPASPTPPAVAAPGQLNPTSGIRTVTCSGKVRESENIGSVTKIVCDDGMEVRYTKMVE